MKRKFYTEAAYLFGLILLAFGAAMMERADLGRFKPEVEIDKLTKIIELTVSGLMTEQFICEAFQPELFVKEIERYLSMLKRMSYRE